MPRWEDRLYADTSHSGGWLFFGAPQIFAAGAATIVLTRNAQFDWSWNRTAVAGEAFTAVWNCSIIRRLIESYQAQGAFQEQFKLGPPVVGRPPFTGVTGITPPTAAGPAKGIRITDIAAVYQVGVANLTAASLAFAEAQYAESVANVFTAIPISATALPLGFQATPHVAVRSVNVPTFVTDDLSDLVIEFAFTMQNTGTIRVYGIGVHCDFNYN